MKRILLLPVLAAALIGAAVAVLPVGPAAAADRTIAVQNFSFGSALTVSVGDRVIWSNGDSAPHTATSDAGVAPAFDTGNIAPGATGSVTFATAGTFAYTCKIHPNMHGTITVSAAAAPTSAATTPAGASPQAPPTGSGLAEDDGGLSAMWFIAGGAVLIVLVAGGAAVLRRRA